MHPIDFSRLFQRDQGFSLPVLIQLKHPERKNTWYFTSNDQDIQFDNKIYKAVPMSYKFPTSRGGVPQGGTLEIDIDQQHEGDELLKWFDEIDHMATIDVIGLINEQGEIVQISQITQSHGSITWDGEKISWTLGADDRLNMQINPWTADNDFLLG